MALFHLNVSSIGKSSESSAVASAAYRSCSSLVQSVIDPQTGIEVRYLHDFSNKGGLAFSQVLAPEGLDSWCYNREQLWNKVERREAHIKGRYARDIKLALQKEFTLEQNIQILSEYVKGIFVKDGIIADVNIHMDDVNNPHAHIMLTTRSVIRDDNDNCVFGNKNRLLDSKSWLVWIRNNWADINNKYFQIYDIDKTITHESYKTRGFEFIQPTIHEGATIHVASETKVLDRAEYNRNIVKANLHYIKENPDELIQALAKNKGAVKGGFSRVDLFREIEVFLNDIALRNGEHQILIVEARESVLARCDAIFAKINQYDISLDLDSQTQSQNQFSQNIDSPNDISYENVTSLIEDFYLNIENKVKVSDEVEFIKNNLMKLIENASKGKAVFNSSDLAKSLDTHLTQAILSELDSEDTEKLNKVKDEILKKYNELLRGLTSSKDIVKLVDSDLGGKEVFTTKEQLALEKEFLGNVEYLSKSRQHSLGLENLSPEPKGPKTKLVEGLSNVLTPEAGVWLENILTFSDGKSKRVVLSDEQEKAVLRLVNGGDLIALSGMPGTGKSTVMAKLVQEYNNHGYEVVGGAISAVAALNLGNEANIESYSLSKWQYDWEQRAELEENGEEVRKLLPQLTSKSVMIIDEMSMVDLKTYNYFLTEARRVGAKIIPIGDNNQFGAMIYGGASEKVTEKCEVVALTELFRQHEPIDKEITRKLANYKVDEAIVLLDREGRVKVGNNPDMIRSELVNHYIEQVHQESDSGTKQKGLNKNDTRIIIAYSNNEVKELNLNVRHRLLNSGLLYSKTYEAGGREFKGKNGFIKIALGEQIVFTKNHRYLGVMNGQLGRVVSIVDDSRFKVQLLGKDAKGEPLNKTITINNDKFDSFDYGYAITAHKSQGSTYDYVFLLLDSLVGYEAFNVMATRHRISSTFYIAKEVLTNIISRKFDNTNELFDHSNELLDNKNSALFELLARRNPNTLAHDYIDYDKKPEVVQIREYLEVRNKASDIYRQLLDWQEKEDKAGRKQELWQNKELWLEFKELRALRQQHALELVEGYPQYQKYINSSVINYATLLKHADMASIEFNYTNNTQVHNSIISQQQSYLAHGSNLGYHELTKLQKEYLTDSNKHNSKLILLKVEDLISLQEDHKYKLSSLSSQISKAENKKWALESELKSHVYYREDMKHYLNKTYKDGAKQVLSKWDELHKSLGLEKALLRVKSEPEVLGSLVGTGWGTKLAVSEKRAIAVFNLKTLTNRFVGYEHSIVQEHKLSKEITNLETSELIPLKTQYKEASSIKLLGPAQEKHLYELQTHREDLSGYLKGHDQNSYAIKSQEASELKIEKTMTTRSIFNQDKYYNKYSYEELHDRLSGDMVSLAKQLLPNISNKEIEIQKHKIICGSIQIEREGNKRGLWYRFSNGSEKGDLFDLIKLSQGLANKKEAIEWGKSYLGLDRDIKSNAQIKVDTTMSEGEQLTEFKKVPAFKVLAPVPKNAVIFNPKSVFAYHLKNKAGENKQIEGVYAYKNIKNELCGYVVRIKDLESGSKVTLPAVYTENTKGIRSWRSKGLGEERCLYNEQRLSNSNKPVLIVEGEKTADIAQSLYPEFDVVTWSGGVNGFNKTNWNVLQGKQVTIWPDNDKPGINAAHNIKSLLESKGITKASVVDLSKIEFLPEKWDLADNIPDKVKQYQVIGALYAAEGITKDTRITETIKSYIEYRQESLKEQSATKEITSLSLYIKEKEVNKCRLHFEEKLTKGNLQSNAVLSNYDKAFIDINAKELVNDHIKSLNLSPDAMAETISSQVQHDLGKIYQTVPKDLLMKVTKTAIESSQQIIAEHSHNQNTKLNFTKSDLPVLSLSLASDIIDHHNKSNSIEYNNIDPTNINNQGHQEHHGMHPQDRSEIEHNNITNMIKNSFKMRIEQELHNFEQHQQHQQVIQKKMSQHQGIEM
ncbi:MAG: MobA/MobL family protein [Rickettsiales bacterium]|jgi:ATP-dependent exoDNAse (exonuclease V) alpha subunit|nr:MobA/MobL family protein [Rickettsiales bacterium]